MKIKRKCQHCGKSDHMVRVVDAKMEVYDVRYRICYACHPELDAGSHLNGPDGGMKAMKNDLRDASWDYCESIPKNVSATEEEERYADEDTIVDLEEMA